MNRTKIKNLAMGAVMTAVMCILAPISIPIKPVPISLGVFSAFLTGLLLPGNYAVSLFWPMSALLFSVSPSARVIPADRP